MNTGGLWFTPLGSFFGLFWRTWPLLKNRIYVCHTAERFYAVATVLAKMVEVSNVWGVGVTTMVAGCENHSLGMTPSETHSMHLN